MSNGRWRRILSGRIRAASMCILIGCLGIIGTLEGVVASAGVAEATANPRAWTIVPSANSTFSQLYSVSCTTPTACMAVGSSGTGPLAERWDGSEWSIVPAPSSPGELSSISCSSETSCKAVGGALIESWNGSTWSVDQMPSISGRTILKGVSCVTAADCTAVGETISSSTILPLVESWNGTVWAVVSIPIKSGTASLNSVSCTTVIMCVAVGSRHESEEIFAESWNGSNWKIDTVPVVSGAFSSVSCATSWSCVAVGSRYGETTALWNGNAWTISSANRSFPVGDISCPSANSCIGVASETIQSATSQVEYWNGQSWTDEPIPLPLGFHQGGLFGVSCLTVSDCEGVGYSETVGQVVTTLAEQEVPAVSITSSSSDSFTQGVTDGFVVTASSSPSPSIAEQGALPTGITFVDNGNGTASLAGTSSASGTFAITITASNGGLPNAIQSFTLTVNPPVTAWTQQSPDTTPGNLVAASMAYDPATDQQLLFGGIQSANTYADGTWTWNGTTWTPLSPAASPPARANASMAYDAATGQMLLFGGLTSGATYLNDTWTWNGTTWTQLSPATSPPVRYNASMVYDPATSQLLLFGGIGTGTTTGGDTWAWNGTTWTQLTPATSPSSRSRAMVTYDPATSQMLLFGGTTGTGSTTAYLNDTWTWDGTTWTQLSPASSPSGRGYGTFGFDATTQQLLLFGGIISNTTSAGDSWNWTGTTWTQLSPTTSPSARYRTASTYDPTTSQFILYGGSPTGSTYLGDTWTYAPVPATAPGAPIIGTATAGNAQATVMFNPPSTNNGSAITSYTVTATDLTNSVNGNQSASGPGSPITVAGLTNGDSYAFTVTATNGVGTGPISSASNTVVPATIPSAPIIGTATGGNDRASVAFTPPSNGGSAITSYTVTATDLTNSVNGGETASGSGSPTTVTGLTNGDSYTFTVTATNTMGTGPASSASNAVTPATVPGAPIIGTATPGNASASVTFAPPTSNGGATISGYTVTATDLTNSVNGGETASGATSPITVAGLTNGDSYSFTVTATNSAGTGPESGASNTVTPFAPISITSVTPGQVAQGATVTVVIAGTGFLSPVGVVISGGGGVTPTLVSVTPTAVTITAKVSSVATLGARDVTVSDANGTATCTGCLTITPAPTLTSANPSQMAVGATGSVTFLGSGLQSGATVRFTGPSTGVTAVAASIIATGSTLTAKVKAAAGAATGAYTVKITNPDKSTATCTGCLTVIAAPTLASITPASAARSTTHPVTVTGTGFATGAKVTGPKGVTFSSVVVVNSTTITATMKVSATATTGSNLGVTVTNDAAAGYGKATAGLLSIT